ncbi:MAG: type IV toxin-antitoxin system AbiEi family antitoxin domain-containing protein, partial [Deltaproteobacteria bacterium]|nr:type IV toxin-antitoxin system AbiEi family antitoxin domain-containing protein [Deltaproteobacteria bacterium]
VGRGAYSLYADEIDWSGAVYALQKQLNLEIYPGGKTALELKGFAHYLQAKEKVYLYCNKYNNLPSWFAGGDWQTEIMYTQAKLFKEDCHAALTDYTEKNYTIKISAPERAAMEMLYHVPRKISFSEASLIMENLTTLRPDLVQQLLEKCKFVNVKRLFMYMADTSRHPWFKKIDSSKIEFGKGKRQVVKGGRLDKKYLITVPNENKDTEGLP